jgi:hypothetical protein
MLKSLFAFVYLSLDYGRIEVTTGFWLPPPPPPLSLASFSSRAKAFLILYNYNLNRNILNKKIKLIKNMTE